MQAVATDLNLFLPCASGGQAYLAQEVRTITQKEATPARAGVALRGNWNDVLRLNLHSRLAQRVLIRLRHSAYRTEQDIYDQATQVAWESWFSLQNSFKVNVTAQRSPLQSLNFAALKIKDALCDRFRSHLGARPNVDTQYPQVRVFAHLDETHLSLYIDTSGQALFKRGWRENTGTAPLKETLAATMLYALGWPALAEQEIPLYDPCCGSGTLLIEAAQMACRIPAGGMRRFGFEHLRVFNSKAWQELRNAAQAQIRPSPAPVYGSDIAFRMVDFSRRNAERAGVAQTITLRGGDALERLPPCEQGGVLLLNPPYGERIESAGKAGQVRTSTRSFTRHTPNTEAQSQQALGRESAEDGNNGALFFSHLASHWKRHFSGWTAWVLSPDPKLAGQMRLQESRRTPLWNGPIECRFFRFDLKAGHFSKTQKQGVTTQDPSAVPCQSQPFNNPAS